MAATPFNRQSVIPEVAQQLGRELLAEVGKAFTGNGAGGPDVDVIRDLVRRGADLEITDDDGKTPLLLAASKGRTAAAEVLLDLGAKPDAKDKNGVSPLIFATLTDNLRLVSKILDTGINPDQDWYRNRTPLMWASNMGKRDVASELAKRGSDILAKSTDSRKLNSIEWAEDNNKVQVAKDLKHLQERKEEAAREQAAADKMRQAELLKAADLAKIEIVVKAGTRKIAAPHVASFGPKKDP